MHQLYKIFWQLTLDTSFNSNSLKQKKNDNKKNLYSNIKQYTLKNINRSKKIGVQCQEQE